MAQDIKLEMIPLFLDNNQAAQRQKEVTTEQFFTCILPECKHVCIKKPVQKIVVTCSHRSCDEREILQKENWSAALFGRPETFSGANVTPLFQLGPKETTAYDE